MAFDPANRGGAGGSNYTFSRTASGQGNWNTGGSPTAMGSFARGLSQMPQAPQIGGAKNSGQTAPRIAPAFAPPVPQVAAPEWGPLPSELTDWPGRVPPGHKVNDVFGPTYRMDPGVLAQMTRQLQQPIRNPNGNYPAQFNGGGPGRSFTGGPRNSGGSVGGGMGGGGGGGW